MLRYDKKYESIPDLVAGAARDYGDQIAIDDAPDRWSFREVEERMVEAARALISLGVDPGDRVALCAPNSARWVQAALGIHAAGAILVPLNTRFKGPELAHILRTSGAVAVITVGEFLGTDFVAMLCEAAPELPATKKIITIDEYEVDGVLTFSQFIAEGASVDPSEVERRVGEISGDLYSDIMFTSGTTGAPKGVPLKHSQSIRAYGHLTEVFGFQRGDVFAIIPPFFHTFGYKAGWLANLIHGVTTIPLRAFDPQQLMQTIQDKQVSILLGPPTLFVDLMNHPERHQYDLSSLRIGVPSAAQVSRSVYAGMREILGFETVLSAYGLTEATSFVTTSHPGDDLDLIASSVGRPGEGIEVIIADGDRRCAPGESGEILVRGYNVMDGYWEDADATAKVFSEEGYLRTGDIGWMDEAGYVRITDRLKDMFIVGGFNAYPAEIEDLLIGFDKLMHVAVVGVSDERMGEVGAAFVVPKPGVTVTEDDVIAYARANMANFKVPRYVVIVDDLPRNASMKVLKHELREQAVTLLSSQTGS